MIASTGMEVVPMILLVLVLAAVVAAAFAVVVVGVQITDHRMGLRNSRHHGRAEAFARKVLGVYAGQQLTGEPDEDTAASQRQARR